MQGLGLGLPGWGVYRQDNPGESSVKEVPDHDRGDPTRLGMMSGQD